MRGTRFALVMCVVVCLIATALAISSGAVPQSQPAPAEQSLWRLENAYWRYVQQNDLKSYIALWHQDFLGWPGVSATPVRRDSITNWIFAQTSQGHTLKSFEIKPASVQVSGDIGVTCYWVNYTWADKDGKGEPLRSRILHTWRKTGDTWQILSGMSMPEAVPPKQ
jgi:ketosteroid isomerase-like protein